MGSGRFTQLCAAATFLFQLKILFRFNGTHQSTRWGSKEYANTAWSTLSESPKEQRMTRDSILVFFMVLLLLVLFLVTIMSDAVALAVLPVLSRKSGVSSTVFTHQTGVRARLPTSYDGGDEFA